MLIELGNHARRNPTEGTEGSPSVTYVHIPTGDGGLTLAPGLDVDDFRRHVSNSMLFDRPTNRPDHEAALVIPNLWSRHATDTPAWVSGDATEDGQELQRIISEFYDIPAGRPSYFEDVYYRHEGKRLLAPGVPSGIPDVQMLFTNTGRLIWSDTLGGGQVGTAGTATATSATSLTSGAITSVTTNQYAGYRIFTGTAWANIISHTSGTTPVFTLDQWYNPATPGGAAASTPSGTTTFIITDGGSTSAWFVGITSTNISPVATDTSLSGEQTANGLQRKLAPFAITSATSPATYTLTPVYTYTGSGAVTLYAIGAFVSNVKSDVTDTMVFETSLNASATVNTSGDQVTVTETVTGS